MTETIAREHLVSEHEQELRQLAHDARVYLSVVMTGVYALSQVREDPEQFAETCTTIKAEGAEPLIRCLESLIDRALQSALATRPK